MHSTFKFLVVFFLMLFFSIAKAVAEEDGHEEHEHAAEGKTPIAFSIGCHGGLVGAGITNSGGTLLGHGDCHAGIDIHGHTENGQWFEIDIGPALGLHIEEDGVSISSGGVIDSRWGLAGGKFRLYAGLEVHADAEDAEIALSIIPHMENRRSFGIGTRLGWMPASIPDSHPGNFSGIAFTELSIGVVLRLETGHMTRGIYELMIIGSRAGFNDTSWCQDKCGSLQLQLRVGFDHHVDQHHNEHDHHEE